MQALCGHTGGAESQLGSEGNIIGGQMDGGGSKGGLGVLAKKVPDRWSQNNSCLGAKGGEGPPHLSLYPFAT